MTSLAFEQLATRMVILVSEESANSHMVDELPVEVVLVDMLVGLGVAEEAPSVADMAVDELAVAE